MQLAVATARRFGVDLRAAAARLGVHYQTVYRAVRSGQLTAVRVGRRYDVSEEALDRYVRARKVAEVKPSAAMLEHGSSELEELRVMAEASRFGAQACFDAAAMAATSAGGDAVALHLLSDDRQSMQVVAAAVGPLSERAALAPDLLRGSIDVDTPPWSAVVAGGRLLHTTSIDESMVDALRERWNMPDLPAPLSHTLVPVIAFGRVVGVLGAAVMTDDGVVDDFVDRLRAIGEICGLAIEVSRRFTEAFDAADLIIGSLEGRQAAEELDLASVVGDHVPAAVFDGWGAVRWVTPALADPSAGGVDVSALEALADVAVDVLATGEDLQERRFPGRPELPVVARVVRRPDGGASTIVLAAAPFTRR